MTQSLKIEPQPDDAMMWIIYPVVSFLIVFFGLYLSNKDWKGILGPEEVDAGPFNATAYFAKRAQRYKQRARARQASFPTNTVD